MEDSSSKIPQIACQMEGSKMLQIACKVEGSSSQMLQIAWKIATTRSPGKIPKNNLTMSYLFSAHLLNDKWWYSKPSYESNKELSTNSTQKCVVFSSIQTLEVYQWVLRHQDVLCQSTLQVLCVHVVHPGEALQGATTRRRIDFQQSRWNFRGKRSPSLIDCGMCQSLGDTRPGELR